jgi:hypothetical protein
MAFRDDGDGAGGEGGEGKHYDILLLDDRILI